MAGLSYMQRRRSGIYEFRKRLPTELAGRSVPAHLQVELGDLVNPKTGLFKRELVRSLSTSDYREAKRRDLREARKALALFDSATRALASREGAAQRAIGESPDLAAIEAETVATLLAQDDVERSEGDDRRRLQSREERAQWPDLVSIPEAWAKGMAEEHAHAYGIEIEDLSAEYREAYARRDPAIVRAETITVHRNHGIPIDPTSAAFHEVGMAVLRGHVAAFHAMLRRQRGEIVDTPPPSSRSAAKGPKLSEAFALWQEGSRAAGARKPGRSGILEAKPAVRWFTELHGDMRIGDITRAHAREYQRALARLPKRLPDDLRGLTLRQLITPLNKGQLDGYEVRNATSVNKTITMLAAIVSFAQREGLLDDVPGFVSPFGKDVKLRVDKRVDEGREPFSPSDLQAIFSMGVFTRGERPAAGGGEAAFWFPLIALLSGMRLEEIAGLRVEDLRQDEETGRWFFDVNPRGGRSVKTASSIRKVPLHPELERIGLLRYRQSLAATARLWPSVSAAEGRPVSAQWSKWFGRFLRGKVGITDRRKVMHSFRHTFKRLARDAGIPEEMHDAISGHAGGGGVGKTYGRGVSLKPLIEAMDRILAPGAVSRLAWDDSRLGHLSIFPAHGRKSQKQK